MSLHPIGRHQDTHTLLIQFVISFKIWLSSSYDLKKIKTLYDGAYVEYDMSSESISYNIQP